MKNNYKHQYIMTSERRHSDEIENVIYSNKELEVGDYIILDGLRWYVDEVII